jgi:hypothetical protein
MQFLFVSTVELLIYVMEIEEKKFSYDYYTSSISFCFFILHRHRDY